MHNDIILIIIMLMRIALAIAIPIGIAIAIAISITMHDVTIYSNHNRNAITMHQVCVFLIFIVTLIRMILFIMITNNIIRIGNKYII